jgi:plastocyanin
MSSRRRCLFALVPALALAACGGGGGGSSSTPTAPANPNLTVIAEESHCDQKQYTVAAGEVRVAYENKGTQTHTFVVQDPKGDDIAPKLRVGPGKETGGVYQLPAGTYTVYCDITGHRAAGMVATLTVTP